MKSGKSGSERYLLETLGTRGVCTSFDISHRLEYISSVVQSFETPKTRFTWMPLTYCKAWECPNERGGRSVSVGQELLTKLLTVDPRFWHARG
jgi:hypothetical protein